MSYVSRCCFLVLKIEHDSNFQSFFWVGKYKRKVWVNDSLTDFHMQWDTKRKKKLVEKIASNEWEDGREDDDDEVGDLRYEVGKWKIHGERTIRITFIFISLVQFFCKNQPHIPLLKNADNAPCTGNIVTQFVIIQVIFKSHHPE